ncbi:peptidylprolyl isomerase [Chloroflexota bacterium]
MAQNGDTVKVHYTGTLDDGTQFDSSVGGDPLEFTLGGQQMILGFEQAVLGMKVGESKTVTIPAADAYGAYRDDLLIEVSREQLPEGMNPAVGDQLQMTQSNGVKMIVPVTGVTETTVTVDANHSLAGKDLTFEVELVEIN